MKLWKILNRSRTDGPSPEVGSAAGPGLKLGTGLFQCPSMRQLHLRCFSSSRQLRTLAFAGQVHHAVWPFLLQWDIVTNKLQFMNDRRLISFTMGAARWNSWDDLKKVYKYSMELPLGAKYWNNDLWFGTQRVQGCNPVLIRLCRKIPPKYVSRLLW